MLAIFLQTYLNLHRSVAPFIIAYFWEIFGAFLLIHAPEASTEEKTDTSFVSHEHPVVAEEPERAPPVSNDLDVQAHVNGHTGNNTSDAGPPLPAISVTDDLKGGNETTPTVTHEDTRRFSLRKARSHNNIEVGAPALH